MLITLVVAPGRHDGGMSHRLPHGVDVGAGLKELRRKGSTQIMRREGRNLRFVRPGAQQLMDGAGRGWMLSPFFASTLSGGLPIKKVEKTALP